MKKEERTTPVEYKYDLIETTTYEYIPGRTVNRSKEDPAQPPSMRSGNEMMR